MTEIARLTEKTFKKLPVWLTFVVYSLQTVDGLNIKTGEDVTLSIWRVCAEVDLNNIFRDGYYHLDTRYHEFEALSQKLSMARSVPISVETIKKFVSEALSKGIKGIYLLTFGDSQHIKNLKNDYWLWLSKMPIDNPDIINETLKKEKSPYRVKSPKLHKTIVLNA